MTSADTTRTFDRRSLLRTSAGAAGATVVAGALAASGTRIARAQDAPSTELTTEEVVLSLYIETGFDLPGRLAEEFTRQFPNVTFDIRRDQFAVITENGPRVMDSDDAPDLIRLPQLVGPAQDGLLLDLDPYYDAYGWSEWSQSLLAQMRVSEDGIRGSGPLYGLGLGYNVTGIFYNREQAEQIGMTAPPTTIAEMETHLDAALAAGLQPIMQFNDIGGIMFCFQALMNQYQDPALTAAWIFQEPDATFQTDAAVRTATEIQRWGEAGYFPSDANALDYTGMMGRFTGGDGLFMFNGDWESVNLETAMGTNVGFFLAPPETAGAPNVAMSAPATYVVPARAQHPDEIVYFLNWVHTNEDARRIIVETTGSSPGGPSSLPVPEVPADSVTAATLEATNTLGATGVAIDFLANATPGIYAGTFRPELQLLITGNETPEGFVEKVQEAYEDELSF